MSTDHAIFRNGNQRRLLFVKLFLFVNMQLAFFYDEKSRPCFVPPAAELCRETEKEAYHSPCYNIAFLCICVRKPSAFQAIWMEVPSRTLPDNLCRYFGVAQLRNFFIKETCQRK